MRDRKLASPPNRFPFAPEVIEPEVFTPLAIGKFLGRPEAISHIGPLEHSGLGRKVAARGIFEHGQKADLGPERGRFIEPRSHIEPQAVKGRVVERLIAEQLGVSIRDHRDVDRLFLHEPQEIGRVHPAGGGRRYTQVGTLPTRIREGRIAPRGTANNSASQAVPSARAGPHRLMATFGLEHRGRPLPGDLPRAATPSESDTLFRQ